MVRFASWIVESKCFTSTHSFLSLFKAFWFFEDISIPSFSLNFFKKYSTILLSISSPPRWVSPPVLSTLNSIPLIFKIDISKVPPPKSKIQIFLSLSFYFLIHKQLQQQWVHLLFLQHLILLIFQHQSYFVFENY